MKMLMSDYEVTLVNDNMQEFYVRFKGPEESKYHPDSKLLSNLGSRMLTNTHSTLPWRPVEDPRRTTRSVPLQVAQHRLRQPHLPP